MLNSLLHLQSLQTDDELCDFECWIKQLNITVATINTSFQFGLTFDVFINDIMIYDIDLTSLKATFEPNPEVVEDDISLTATISATAMAGLVLNETGGLIYQEGSFKAALRDVSIRMLFHFDKGPDGLIERVTMSTTDCDIDLSELKNDDIEIHIDTSKFIEGLINALKPVLVLVLKNQAGPLVCNNVADLAGDSITDMFEQANVMIRPYLNSTEPKSIKVGPNMIDIRTSSLVDVLRFVLTNFTGADGPLSFNSLANRFTEDTGAFALSSLIGYFGVPMPIDISAPIPALGATINFSLIDLDISGINTWTDFTFLEPVSKYLLDTSTGLDDLGMNLTFLLNVSVDGDTITAGDSVLTESASFVMGMEHNHMDLQLQVASPRGTGDDWTSAMCMNLGCIETLMSPQGTGVTLIQFNTTLGEISLIAEAAEGSMEEEIDMFFNNIVKFFVDNYRNVIPSFLNGAMNNLAVDFINKAIEDLLRYPDCHYIADPPYSDIDKYVTVGVVGGAIALTGIFYAIMRWGEMRDQKANAGTIFNTIQSMDDIDQSHEDKTIGFWASFLRVDEHASLFMTPRLPASVRILIILLILLCTSLFISSNTGLGASVFAKIDVGKKRISLPSMFDFGLINSIIDMWQAGAYALSILIAVMSCAWPYTKLLLMIITWCLPTNILSPKRRESILRVLDALGKWSLVDSYVMVLMLIAFHIHVEFPIMGEQVEDPVAINLYVFPAYGFITLVLGTIFSLALSHIMLALDRYVDKADDPVIEVEDNSYHPLVKYAGKAWIKVTVTILLVASLPIVLAGMYITSFSFSFVGLAGWALDLLGIPYATEYSVINLAYKLPAAGEHPNSFGIRFTQGIYIVVTIIVPILHILGLLISWLVPMKRKAQLALYHASEILYAWSCIDVFIVSILAAVMEISQLARFMVGDKCDMIDPIVEMFFADEPLISGHEVCFDVITVLQDGSYLLFAAVIFHTITTLIVNAIARRAIALRTSLANAQTI